MKTYPSDKIRNIGLFSHGGAGKTSLAEALLYNTGATNRLGKVEEGNTVADYDPEETKRHISVSTALIPCEWKGHKINVLDTPGYMDFVGEVKETARVVDAALIVVCATAGIDVGTEMVWKYTANLPRLIYVSRMDRDNADFDKVLHQLRERYGRGVTPLLLPRGSRSAFDGVIDVIRMKAYRGEKAVEGAIPAELRAAADAARDQLMEAVAETSDELTMKYLDGEPLTPEELLDGLKAGVRAGKIIPVLCGAALHNKTIPPVLDIIVDYMPSPMDRPAVVAANLSTKSEEKLPLRADGPLAALVFKTMADPYVGKVSFYRVYSGVMRSDSRVYNANRGEEERIGQLFTMRGKEQLPTAEFMPGDIGAVAKLTYTSTGDTLCDKDHLLQMAGIEFPHPVFAVAVQPKTKADTDKLSSGVNRLTEEDPTIHVSRELDTGELLLSGMGESHVDVALERMHRKFGVDVITSVPKVPYKETIRTAAKGQGRHKKQTGGRGQFGDVWVRLEPAERGSGFEFLDEVVGGSVPRNYIPAVEKGLREALKTGILAGFPVVDFKAALYYGSYHPVDSSDLAFQLAGIQAFKKVSELAGPMILEPVVIVSVTVPEEYMGQVIGDLNSKRGRVLGMDSEAGFSTVSAEVPQAEMQRYATDIRSMTQGRGIFTMEFARYEEVPAHLVQAIVDQAKKDREEAREAK